MAKLFTPRSSRAWAEMAYKLAHGGGYRVS
jgi:hypothetical protein